MAIVAIKERDTAQLETAGVPFYVREDTGAPLTRALAVSTAQAAAVLSEGSGGEDFRFKRLGDSVARVTIQYRAGDLKNLPPPAAGSASYTFNFRAKARHFFYGLKEVRRVPSDAVDNKRLLNVQRSPGAIVAEHKGILVPAPTITDRITYQFPNPVISAAYRDAMRELFDEGGAIASGTFLGQPRGTMRIVECVSTVRSSGDQTISFGFAYLKNKERIVGEINLGTVNGHDVYWAHLFPLVFPGLNGKDELHLAADYGYVEEVFPYVDFAAMGLPSV